MNFPGWRGSGIARCLRINMLASALIPGGGHHPVAVVIHLAVFLTLQEVKGGKRKRWCKNPLRSTCPLASPLLRPILTIPPYPKQVTWSSIGGRRTQRFWIWTQWYWNFLLTNGRNSFVEFWPLKRQQPSFRPSPAVIWRSWLLLWSGSLTAWICQWTKWTLCCWIIKTRGWITQRNLGGMWLAHGLGTIELCGKSGFQMKVCVLQVLASTIRCWSSSRTTGMSPTRLCARRLGSKQCKTRAHRKWEVRISNALLNDMPW